MGPDEVLAPARTLKREPVDVLDTLGIPDGSLRESMLGCCGLRPAFGWSAPLARALFDREGVILDPSALFSSTSRTELLLDVPRSALGNDALLRFGEDDGGEGGLPDGSGLLSGSGLVVGGEGGRGVEAAGDAGERVLLLIAECSCITLPALPDKRPV